MHRPLIKFSELYTLSLKSAKYIIVYLATNRKVVKHKTLFYVGTCYQTEIKVDKKIITSHTCGS